MGRAKIVLLGMLAVAVVSCASVAASRYDPEFEDAPPAVLEGWELTKVHCTQCHALDPVFLNMDLFRDRGDLQLLVADMAAEPGANIPPPDRERIVEALEWYRSRNAGE
jgi:hypothetical protein